MDLAIPVRRVPITVVGADGVTSEGDVFLRLSAPGGMGPERILDRVNDDDAYFAMEPVGGGGLLLVNKAQVSWIALDRELEDEITPVDVTEDAKWVEAEVALSNRGSVRGEIPLVGPSVRPRLSDYLNHLEDSYFPVRGSDKVYLVNRHHVTRLLT